MAENRSFTKDDSYKNLERVNFWIANCDTKASFILAFIAVFITVAFSSDLLINGFESIMNTLLEFESADFKAIFIALIFIDLGVFIWFLVKGIIDLLNTISAQIDPGVFKAPKLVSKSRLFFGSIATAEFNDFQSGLDNLSEREIIDDIDSQTYINSLICNQKFKNYNKGVKGIKTAVFCFITLNLLLFAFNIIF